MPRFRFQLEPVLEQRRRVEEERMRAVAEIERERNLSEQALRALQQSITAERGELRDRLLGTPPPRGGLAPGVSEPPRGVPLAEVRLQASAASHLAVRAQEEAIRLAGIHKRLGAARRLLIEATTARKAVELLRERRYETWRRAEHLRDLAETDELAVMRGTRGGDL